LKTGQFSSLEEGDCTWGEAEGTVAKANIRIEFLLLPADTKDLFLARGSPQ